MRAFLTPAMQWISRNLASLIVIISILVAADYFQEEVNEFILITSTLPTLITKKDNLNQQIDLLKKDALERIEKIDKESEEGLKTELSKIESKIQIETSKQRSSTNIMRSILTGEDVTDDLKRDIGITILEAERYFILQLQEKASFTKAAQQGQVELERLRKIHISVYKELADNERAQANINATSPYFVHIPFTDAYIYLAALKISHGEIFDRNQKAYEKYQWQKKILDIIEKQNPLAKFNFPQDKIDNILQPLTDHIFKLRENYDGNWLAKFSAPVIHVIPTALGILLSIIFVPIAIKVVFYYVIAPLASRRPAIILTSGVSGAIDGDFLNTAGAAVGVKISAVTISVEVDGTHELLVHPEYIQGLANKGTTDTKWLLNYSYPLSSILSGMFALTRIRAALPESFLLSDTKDPFSEIGLISIPEGSAIVIQPHSLIGLIQRINCPIRISRHWRLGSLNAWLTLQLRFLVFHGPAILIIKGCRGIRAEKAGAGRNINQAATIGFSANLAYSNTRCETFASYLMGKKELFNDNFSEGDGFYFYEEMPHFGKKSGITGRGLEGVTDSLLKIFGI